MSEKMLNLLTGLLGKAKAKGADAADAVHIESVSLSVAQRLGNPEMLERSENADVGLRVFVGRNQAIVSSSDMGADALDELVERSVAMARSVPEDPYCGLAEPDQLATDIIDLDACDPNEPSTEHLVDLASRAEDAARAVDGVTNSEGAEAGWGRAAVSVAASNGFAQTYAGSHYSLSASVLAGEGPAISPTCTDHLSFYRCRELAWNTSGLRHHRPDRDGRGCYSPRGGRA